MKKGSILNTHTIMYLYIYIHRFLSDKSFQMMPSFPKLSASIAAKDEWPLAETVATYWTNFAKSGNPNLPRNEAWP